jgi:protoporphyrin/coproporphyrin ferrochelatase
MSFLYRTPSQPVPEQGRAGVLLVNLGTPDALGYRAVRRYLLEFLSDQRVIEASPFIWQPILRGIVLATRPFTSGANYARIWDRTRDESPLRTHTRGQAEGLSARLKDEGVPVEWGMRYGNPSVAAAMDRLMDAGCDRIVVLPLYPQYSATTTATANDQVFRALMELRRQPAIRTVPPFPDDPRYIDALSKSIRTSLSALPFRPQRLVASFHGIPKAYVEKGDSYPQDCERTITALRQSLDLREEQMPLTYQSRFGPTEWIQPYTAPFVAGLPAEGVTRIAVVMPGFMTDCIETLDEIGRELREEFMHAGGEEFALVPCLNSSPEAIDLIEALSRDSLAGWL